MIVYIYVTLLQVVLSQQYVTIGSGFNGPRGVFVDTIGNVFVADWGNAAVKKVSLNGVISSIGSGFVKPYGLFVDSSGTVYVADTGFSTIKKIAPDGTITDIGSGFNKPKGVYLDSIGNIIVADNGNNAVKRINLDGSISVIGSGFISPHGVFVDTLNNIFVADTNSVSKVSVSGTINVIGSGFNDPHYAAVDADANIFVADFGNNALKKVDRNGVISVIDNNLHAPSCLFIDALGTLFIADTNYNIVKKIAGLASSQNPTFSSLLASQNPTFSSLLVSQNPTFSSSLQTPISARILVSTIATSNSNISNIIVIISAVISIVVLIIICSWYVYSKREKVKSVHSSTNSRPSAPSGTFSTTVQSNPSSSSSSSSSKKYQNSSGQHLQSFPQSEPFQKSYSPTPSTINQNSPVGIPINMHNSLLQKDNTGLTKQQNIQFPQMTHYNHPANQNYGLQFNNTMTQKYKNQNSVMLQANVVSAPVATVKKDDSNSISINDGNKNTATSKGSLTNNERSIVKEELVKYGGTTMVTSDKGISLPGYMNIDSAFIRLGKTIGAGGMGDIFECEYMGPLREVQNLNGRNIVAKSMKGLAERGFVQEVSIMALFSNHNNFAEIIGYNQEMHLIIMIHYSLGSFDSWIKNAKFRNILDIITVVSGMFQALLDLHALGIVHYDIKPANILLERNVDGKLIAKLTDFGIAQIVQSSVLVVEAFDVVNVRGMSIPFASPERFIKSRRDYPADYKKRSDVYSAAMVIYVAINGTSPWH